MAPTRLSALPCSAMLSFIFVFVAVTLPTADAKIAILANSNSEFNTLGRTGCIKAATEIFNATAANSLCEYIIIASPTVDNVRPYAIDPTYNLIIALGFLFETPVKTLAVAYQNATFSVIDVAINPGEDPLLKNNMQGIIFAEDEGGYMAGLVAGLVTTTRRVGVITAFPFASLLRFSNGFLRGVDHSCPKCSVFRAFVPSFVDADLGVNASNVMLDAGVDVIYGAGGSMGSAAILNAAQKGAFVIGVDTDESKSTFLSRPASEASKIVTSSEKRTDTGAYVSVRDKLTNRFTGGNKLVDMAVGGIALSPCSSALGCSLLQVETSVLQLGGAVSLVGGGSDANLAAQGGSDCGVVKQFSRQQYVDIVAERIKSKGISTGVGDGGYLNNPNIVANKTWTALHPFGPMPTGRSGHASAFSAVDNFYFAFGGDTGSGGYSNKLLLLDYDWLEWRDIASTNAPVGLAQHSLQYHNGKLFLFGGTDSTFTFKNDLYVIDFVADNMTATFTKLAVAAPWPDARIYHATTSIGSTMYMYGGFTASLSADNSLWSFNYNTRVWTSLPMLGTRPPALRAAAITPSGLAGNNTLVLFGGQLSDGSLTNAVYVYNIGTGVWSSVVPAGQQPSAIRNHGATILSNGKILYAGGVNSLGPTGDVRLLDTVQMAWLVPQLPSLPQRVHSFGGLHVFRQTDKTNPCQYPVLTFITLCVPQSRDIMLYFGGFDSADGPSNDVRLVYPGTFANPVIVPIQVTQTSSSGTPAYVIPVAVVVPLSVALLAILGFWRAAVNRRKMTEQLQKKAYNWIVAWADLDIREKIGEGSFGLVYRGVYRGAEVAVKTLKNELSGADIGNPHASLRSRLVVKLLRRKSADSALFTSSKSSVLHNLVVKATNDATSSSRATDSLVLTQQSEKGSAPKTDSKAVVKVASFENLDLADMEALDDMGPMGPSAKKTENNIEKFMSNVYQSRTARNAAQGKDRSAGKTVILDSIMSNDSQKSSNAEAMYSLNDFEKEIETMVSLRHPNIVMFMGACLELKNLAILTEFMHGGSVYDFYSDETMPIEWDLKASMALDAANGMVYLHSARPPILHRDMKSPNLLIDSSMRVKVSDFGLAEFKSTSSSSNNKIGGSLVWMSPTVLNGEAFQEGDDVYSFGIVLTELINRTLPYSELDLDIGALIALIAFHDLRPTMPRDVPEGIAKLVHDCVEGKPENRPSFAAIAERLKQFAANFANTKTKQSE